MSLAPIVGQPEECRPAQPGSGRDDASSVAGSPSDSIP